MWRGIAATAAAQAGRIAAKVSSVAGITRGDDAGKELVCARW
jgi:hypothetical protein